MKEFFDGGEYTTRNKFKDFFDKIYHKSIEQIAEFKMCIRDSQ